jgi:hypothetical protein
MLATLFFRGLGILVVSKLKIHIAAELRIGIEPISSGDLTHISLFCFAGDFVIFTKKRETVF